MITQNIKRLKWALQKRKAWKTFRAVMEFYYECKANMHACQPVNYDGNAGASSYCVGKVIMLPSDFTSDVEIAAKRVLDPAELEYFKYTYVNRSEINKNTAQTEVSIKVQEKLGDHFFRIGMYPIDKYMKTIRK